MKSPWNHHEITPYFQLQPGERQICVTDPTQQVRPMSLQPIDLDQADGENRMGI